jgi:TPR repeat protein
MYRWHLKAAEAGNVEAMFFVANAYQFAHGCKRNYKVRPCLFLRLHRACGCVCVLVLLLPSSWTMPLTRPCARAHLSVCVSMQEAARWYEAALTAFLRDEARAPTDAAAAADFAATASYGPTAMFNVGLLYQLGGDGLDVDLGKAVMWWEHADNGGSGAPHTHALMGEREARSHTHTERDIDTHSLCECVCGPHDGWALHTSVFVCLYV